MGEIINLRQVRKRRAQAAREAEDDANRIRFGRTKAQRLSDAAHSERADKDLAGHKLEREDD